MKSGFSWPGFFFTWIWAFVSGLWIIGAVLLAVNLVLAVIAYGVFGGDALIGAILSLAFQFLVGVKGNSWKSKSLESRDYYYLCTVPANSPAAAQAKLQQVGAEIPPEWRTRLPFTALSLAPARVRQLCAMAWLTLKAAFRYRLVQILIVLLLGAVVGLPGIIKHDGTAQGFTQILLTYTLGTITTLLGFATLWLACGTLARDVEECQMQMVAVKPIARWEIWVGKWTGIMLLNLLLLAVSGVAVYVLMQWRAGQLSPETQQQLRNEVLVARGSLRQAVDPAAIEAQVERRLQERLKDSQVATMDRDFVRKQIREDVKARLQIVPPGQGRPWVIRTGIISEKLRDQPLQLRIKFFPAQKNASGTYVGVWEIGPPNGRRYHLEQPSLAAETFHEFTVPPNLLDENGDLYIAFFNLNETSLLFPLDEGIEVLRHCFTGEKFSFHGKRYDFDDVVIRPRYVQPGGPPLWIAAMSEPGAQRAARNDSNFLPQGARSMVLDPWRATLKASGRNPDLYRVGIIRSCLVTDDAERDWPAVRAAERYRGQVYRSFNKDESAAGGVAGNTREASIPQTWVVGNVEHCVKELTSFVREYGITDLVTWAVPPGMRPEQMNGSLERFVRDVAPRVKAAAAAA